MLNSKLRHHPVIFGAALLLFGCGSTGGFVPTQQQAELPLIPGEATLEMQVVKKSELSLPTSSRMSNGSIMKFSPFEFRTIKDRFAIETAVLPLGRYAAVRHSGEGLTAGLTDEQSLSFNLHYDARYPDLKSARHDFPSLATEKFREISTDGTAAIEIQQWQFRLTMIFSKQRQAFQVLLDQADYTAPTAPEMSEDEPAPVKIDKLPVVVAFSYRHPDSASETLIQQNVFFEFMVANQTGTYQAKPQISGWVPLPVDAKTAPYTIGIVVAEVHETQEDYYKKLFDVLKSVRGII
jgi:hypothetical protein